MRARAPCVLAPPKMSLAPHGGKPPPPAARSGNPVARIPLILSRMATQALGKFPQGTTPQLANNQIVACHRSPPLATIRPLRAQIRRSVVGHSLSAARRRTKSESTPASNLILTSGAAAGDAGLRRAAAAGENSGHSRPELVALAGISRPRRNRVLFSAERRKQGLARADGSPRS